MKSLICNEKTRKRDREFKQTATVLIKEGKFIKKLLKRQIFENEQLKLDYKLELSNNKQLKRNYEKKLKKQKEKIKKVKKKFCEFKNEIIKEISTCKESNKKYKFLIDNYLNYEKKKMLNEYNSKESLLTNMYNMEKKKLELIHTEKAFSLVSEEKKLNRTRLELVNKLSNIKFREEKVRIIKNTCNKTNNKLNKLKTDLKIIKKNFEVMKEINLKLKRQIEKSTDNNKRLVRIQSSSIINIIDSKKEDKLKKIKDYILTKDEKNILQNEVLIEGHGKIKDKTIKKWKTSYFVLNNNYQLIQYKSLNKSFQKGIISLINVNFSKKNKNGLVLTGEFFKKTYYLQFVNDFEKWENFLTFFNKKVVIK